MAQERIIKIKVETGDADKEVKDLGKNIDETGKKADETGGKFDTLFGQLDGLTGGAITKFKSFKGSLKGISLGFKGVGSAIAASGLGLLVIVISSLIAAFKGSEEGQNKFAKLMGVIGAVVGNVVDLFADLGDFIIDLFSGDGSAMKKLKSFGESIFNVVGLPIKNIIDTAKTLGRVLGALFDGDVSKAFDELKQGVDDIKGNFTEATNEIVKATNAVKDFAKQNIDEAKRAAEVADMRAKADKLDRELLIERASLENQIAQLRLKSRQEEEFTAKQRRQALIDAQELEDQLLKKEKEVLTLRADAIAIENTFARSNKENLDAEAEAKAQVIRQEAARTNAQRATQRELNRINKEIARDAQAKAKEEEAKRKEEEKIAQEKIAKEEKAEKDRLDAIEKIQQEFAKKQEDLDADTELKKLALEEDRKIEELDRLKATKEDKLQIERFYQERRQEIIDKQAQEQALKDEDNKLKNLENENLSFEERIALAESQRQAVLSNEKLTEEQRTKLAKQFADARVKITEQEAAAKQAQLESYATALGQVSDVLGKETAAGKALAVASSLISTYSSIAGQLQAFSKVPVPGYAIAQAVATGLVGLKSVQDIISVKVPGESGGANANTSSIRGGSGATTNQPAFNLVGRSNVNQLQTGLEQQETAPVKAFVVSTNVTTQQEADRATESQAAFG